MALSVAVLLLTFIPYAAEGSRGILDNVFLYRGFKEPFGPLMIFLPRSLVSWMMTAVVLLVPIWARRFSMDKALLLCVLAWLLSAPGVGVQYVALLVAVACIAARTARMIEIGICVALIEANQISAAANAATWLGLWFVCAVWFTRLVKGN